MGVEGTPRAVRAEIRKSNGNGDRGIRRNNGEKEKPITKTIDKKAEDRGMAKWVQCHRVRSRRTKMMVKTDWAVSGSERLVS